jgi:hypothetical protein
MIGMPCWLNMKLLNWGSPSLVLFKSIDKVKNIFIVLLRIYSHFPLSFSHECIEYEMFMDFFFIFHIAIKFLEKLPIFKFWYALKKIYPQFFEKNSSLF